MTIPEYQAFMSPLLRLASDNQEHSIQDTYRQLADQFQLSEDERKALLPSGRQETYKNRIGWARTYLAKAGLLENTRRSYYRITARGIEELENHADEISTSYLKKYEEFVDFQTPSKHNSTSDANDTSSTTPAETPEEMFERALSELSDQLASEVLDALHAVTPSHFERIVVDLLVAMGYGGSRREAAEVVGKSGDEGIDGIIKEDRLGLDTIYIQAKRWENVVGRPEIQKFVGALQGQRAHKGVFITASRFSEDAESYAKQVQNTVILIDGKRLAKLMIEHEIGTTTIGSYAVKRIDTDFFTEE